MSTGWNQKVKPVDLARIINLLGNEYWLEHTDGGLDQT